jgi:ribosomal protein S14
MWFPEYPIIDKVDVKKPIEDGDSITFFYYRTERRCKYCGQAFERGEFPPEFKNNTDSFRGKEVCMDCGSAMFKKAMPVLQDLLDKSIKDGNGLSGLR